MIRSVMFAVFLVGAGCSDEPDARSGAGSAGSSGESPVAAQDDASTCGTGGSTQTGAPVAVEAVACRSVGVLTGDLTQEFDQVRTPFLLRDGTLAVPTTGSNSIRLFGLDGRLLKELGRPGQGPGEFGYLASAWARGDTIEAFDLTQQRLIRFFPSDSIETIPLREARASAIYGTVGAGWATMVLAANMGARDEMTVRAMSRNRTPTQDTLTLLDVAVTQGMHRFRAPGISGPHPLTPTGLVAVHHGQIYVAETLTPIISVYDADGSLAREITIPLTPPTGIAAALRVVVDSAVARADEAERPMTRERWASYAAADRLSTFWALIIDELGFVWVRPYDPVAHSIALDGDLANRGGPGGRWLVLSATGAEVGWIDIPDGLEPAHITANAVVGVYRDELDVESVRVHRLRRS